MGAIIVALARPQSLFSEESITTEGIDIVLAMDVSTSMWAVDFQPNRIEAAKRTAAEFIEGRPYDRIGLVVFAGESFTQCPITLDHRLLLGLVKDADAWQLQDGTALGDGLWMGLNRLIDSTALQSKVIILLTDGVQTAGEFAPLDAARAASDLGIRIYTIGIGSRSSRNIPVLDKRGQKIFELDPQNSLDEETMTQIAELTGGQYFRATSTDKLREIYDQIDQLEKEKIDVNVSQRYQEKFYPFAWMAVLLLLVEILLAQTVFRTAT
jgi:Ca-activated chloride channel family protein